MPDAGGLRPAHTAADLLPAGADPIAARIVPAEPATPASKNAAVGSQTPARPPASGTRKRKRDDRGSETDDDGQEPPAAPDAYKWGVLQPPGWDPNDLKLRSCSCGRRCIPKRGVLLCCGGDEGGGCLCDNVPLSQLRLNQGPHPSPPPPPRPVVTPSPPPPPLARTATIASASYR